MASGYTKLINKYHYCCFRLVDLICIKDIFTFRWVISKYGYEYKENTRLNKRIDFFNDNRIVYRGIDSKKIGINKNIEKIHTNSCFTKKVCGRRF